MLDSTVKELNDARTKITALMIVQVGQPPTHPPTYLPIFQRPTHPLYTFSPLLSLPTCSHSNSLVHPKHRRT